MNENLHDIDKLFKSAIEAHDDMPSNGVWNDIDNKLDKSRIVDINKRYNKLKRVALLLLFLLSGVVFYEYYNNNNRAHPSLVKKNVDQPSTPQAKRPGNIENDPNSQTLINQHNNLAVTEEKSKHLSKVGSHASDYSGSLPGKQNVVVKIVPEKFSKYKLMLQKGIMKTKILVHPTSSENINHTLAIQQENPLSKYQSNMEPQLLNTKSFDNLLMASISNNSIIHSILPPGINTPVDNLVVKIKKNLPKSLIKTSKLYINPFFSPDFAFYSLRNDQPHGRGDDRHDIKKDEKHQFSYSTGILAEYKLTSHLSVQSGISFSKTTINSNSKNIFAERDNSGNIKYRINGSCGYAYILPHTTPPPALGDSIRTANTINELAYIKIPASLKYNLITGKFILSAVGGLGLNILTKGSLNTAVEYGNTKETQYVNNVEGLKNSYLDGLAGLEFQYAFSNRISLNIAPIVRVALTPITQGAAVKTYSNSLGISSGITIKL